MGQPTTATESRWPARSTLSAGVSRRAWGWAAAVGALTVVALLVRLPQFSSSLFGDEVGAYWVVNGHGLGRLIYLLSGHSPEANPPLWFISAWWAEKLFGNSAQSLKLVSLLAGTATVPALYALGRMTISRGAGAVAAVGWTLSPFAIYYSTEARPYALLALLAVLSTLCLLRAIAVDRARWWALYAICSCAAIYTHFTAIFILVAQFLWAFVLAPEARARLVLANVAAAAVFLPWLPNLIHATSSKATRTFGELEPFSLHAVRVDLGRVLIGHPYLSLSQVPGHAALILIVTGALLGAALAAGRLLAERGLVRVDKGLVLVILVALAAPAGALLYSLHESVWDARNLISSLPAGLLLAGAVMTVPSWPWRALPLAVLGAGLVLAAGQMTRTVNQRPAYNDAIAYIDRFDPHGGPIADLVAPTPGPPDETEAALNLAGRAKVHPVFRIGLPPLAEVEAAPPYASLPRQTGQQVAREVTKAAGRGPLFIVAPTGAPVASLEATRRQHANSNIGELAIFATFLGALPSRFVPVTSHQFPGFATVTVYVYRAR
jgi:mannosyltransferase